MADILDFIDSVALREHLQKTGYALSPLERAYVVWHGRKRGLTEKLAAMRELLNTSPDITPEERSRYISNGRINHDALSDGEGYKVFEGIVFRDPAFVSTSTNRFFAKRWANGLNHKAVSKRLKQEAEGMAEGSAEKKQLLRQAGREEWNVTDITGSHVMNMHLKKGTRALFSDTMYTMTGRPRGQDEVTLDSGGTYRITSVRAEGPGQYVFEVELL